MLRFVPPLTEDTAHLSELKIYKVLQESTLDGYVFHSLLLPDHANKVIGEIDFVLVTQHGILCLEVKGGEVLFEEGKWIKIDKYDNNYIGGEGPFKQALGNMFAFISKAKQTFPATHAIHATTIGCGVMFPDISFDAFGMEYDPRWIYDQKYAFKSIDDYLLNLYACWKERSITSGRHVEKLSDTQIEGIHKRLRSDFYFKVKLPAIIQAIDGQQILLTQEQFLLYESLFDNRRVLIEGGAGTGKTMIAADLFAREVEKGAKVLFLTFNKLLAETLKKRLKTPNDASQISCIHDYYINCTGLKEPTDPSKLNSFYSQELPESFSQLESHQKPIFDMVIVDEAQDILATMNLMNIEEMIDGGFASGRWYLFYDSNQNLYNKEFDEGMALINEYAPFKFNLVKNCRNTRQIARYIEDTTSIPTGKVFPITGEEVERIVVKDEGELLSEVQRIVKSLMKDGVSLSDVVILSSHRFENSGLSKVTKEPFKSICKFMVTKPESWFLAPPDTLRFITAYAFKGLETSVVIMIDFESGDREHPRGKAYTDMLRYTAISRAKVKLFDVVVNKDKSAGA